MKKLLNDLSHENPGTKIFIKKEYLEELKKFQEKREIEILWERSTDSELLIKILKNKDFSYIPKKEIRRDEVLKYHNSKMKVRPGQSKTSKKKQYLIFKNKNDEMFYFDAELFRKKSYKGWLRIKFNEKDYHTTSLISVEYLEEKVKVR